MLRRLVFVLVVIVGVSLPLSGIQAQGEGQPPVFCSTLSEADCAILEQAQAAMAGISAAAFEAGLDLVVSSSDPEIGRVAVTVAGNGAMAADMTLMAAFPQPGAAMAEFMSQAPQKLVEFLRTVNGRVNLLITLPKELATEAGIPQEGLPIELVVVGGVVYVNTAALMPAGETEGPAWIGLDVPSMYESMLSMAEGGAPGEMAAVLESEAFQALVNFQNYVDFVRITRLADVEIGGQPAAAFQTVVDYAGLFSSETFQKAFLDYMASVMEMQGESLEEMPEGFMDVMAAIMAGMSLQSTQWVDLKDYHIRHTDMTFGFELNREAIQQLEPEAAEDMPEDLSISLSMNIDLSDFNVPVEVTAPEGAQVFNPMLFMSSMAEGND
ncbi:MAG: hypothetical protein HPY64_17050 [Anaerolineae bacterium]|nr:hypothetical protein [Anaerolineae bacterium]